MKNKFPLIVAILVGVIALLSIKSFRDRTQEQKHKESKGTQVVVAKAAIAKGTELTPELFTLSERERKSIPPQAILAGDDEKLIVGHKALVPIQPSQMILWSDLEGEKSVTLSTIIPRAEGSNAEGAYTVSISRGIQSRLIQPGDHIDIIGSVAIPKSTQPSPNTVATFRSGTEMVNEVLLQNVTVLAVGDLFGKGNRTEGGTGGDLTLSLTLPEAQLLMFASQHGELGALLRRAGATDFRNRSELPRITFDEIEKIVGDLDNKRSQRWA